MISLRLRSHVIIYLSLITLALSLVFIYLSTSRFSQQALSSLNEYGEAMALDSAIISTDFFLTEDYASMQQFVEDFVDRPRVSMVCISDPLGNIITSSDMTMIGQNFIATDKEWKASAEETVKTMPGDKDSKLIVITPIRMDALHLGFARVAISMAGVNNAIAASERQGLLIGLTAWVLTVLLGVYFAGMLSKPMRLLSAQTKRIQKGDFSSTDIVGQQVQELGDFSNTLNVMAKAIGRREGALQEMVTHLDNLPSPVFSVDPQFRITYMNPIAAELTGLSAEQCIGHKCADLFNTAVCDTDQCPMRQAMEQDQVIYGKTTRVHNSEIQFIKYTSVAFRDKDGAITGGLETFTDITELQQTLAESEKQNRLRTAQVSISDQLRGEQDETTLCNTLLSQLAQHISFQIGTLYLARKNDQLHLAASYAGTHSISPPLSFRFGEGITGQTAREKQQIMISQIPEDYFPVFSASGKGLPGYILAHPIIYEGIVLGVIELGSFNEFDDFSLELLNQVLENAAIGINMAQSRQRVNLLLEQTRQQTEELQSQREELQASNEELREQTDILQKSEEQLQQQAEELQSQREELQVTNEELAERTQNLETEQDKVNEKNAILARQRNELLQKTEQLETSSRYKSEFLANMSHELRTPLNSILILSQLFASNKEHNLSEKQIEFAQTINNSGSELLKLINEVLDLAKVEAGRVQLDISPLNLHSFLKDMDQAFSPVANDRGVRFVTSIGDNVPAIITTDAQKMLQIIKNLLSNGIKFTEKGEVQLAINRPSAEMDCADLHSQECIAISITDSGIGIAPDKQESIFEAFQQVDGSISRRYGGTGLGLSIAREFAGLLGGSIQLSSQIDHGSTFTLLLPESLGSQTEQQVKQTAPVSQQKEPAPAKIETTRTPERATMQEVADDRNELTDSDKILLIIEDDPAFTKVLSDLAHERGFKCILANDGESGIHYADFYQPGAIILDIGLPGMDGWQVLDTLRKNPKTSHIPVHFMSAADKSRKAREKGAVGYLVKPVSVEKVHETLELLEKSIASTVKKLLIVEDHKDQRQSMEALIGDPNIDITGVASGNEAWQLLQNNSFDCMILDLGLPDMEGFKLLQMINDDHALQNIPVIIYTGRELSQEEENKLRPYSDSIIIKGIQSPERLLAETTLFLHQVEEKLPDEKRRLLASYHKREDIFANKKVLVVDDDMRNVFALSSALEEKGMEVVAAENGKKGLEMLASHPDVNLVLMDIMMPEMDGFEAISRIREQAAHAKTPIIALTAKAMQGDRLKCIEAGANDYLAKPVDVERLLSMLRVWMC